MEENNKKIIDKIKYLLALANDDKDSEECQNAFLFAQKLMLKYHIDKNEVENEQILDEIDTESVTIFKRLYWWERTLGQIIANNFRVKEFYNNRYNAKSIKQSKIVFYGFGHDLELAKEMYILAYDALKNYVDDYMQMNHDRILYNGENLRTARKEYTLGFLDGLENKFNKQVHDLKGKYELIVQTPKEVEEAYQNYSKDFNKIKINIPAFASGEHYDQGEQDANNIDFTRSTLDNMNENIDFLENN